MKQTAVEWLWEQYNNECDCGGDVEYTLAEKLFEQAKAIEKEQIIDSFNEGFTEGCRYTTGFEQTLWQDEDDYYDKTYKQQ